MFLSFMAALLLSCTVYSQETVTPVQQEVASLTQEQKDYFDYWLTLAVSAYPVSMAILLPLEMYWEKRRRATAR